jgi:hypothetical protein
MPSCFVSQRDVIGIATRLRVGGFGIRILLEARDFSFLQNVQMDSETITTSVLFPWRKVAKV